MTAVLAGLEETSGFDPRGCEGYVGTSAGSIVAAALVAGVDPRTRLGNLPEQPPVANTEMRGERGMLTRMLGAGSRRRPDCGRAACCCWVGAPPRPPEPWRAVRSSNELRGVGARSRGWRTTSSAWVRNGTGACRSPRSSSSAAGGSCSAPPRLRRQPWRRPCGRPAHPGSSSRWCSTGAATSMAACGARPAWTARRRAAAPRRRASTRPARCVPAERSQLALLGAGLAHDRRGRSTRAQAAWRKRDGRRTGSCISDGDGAEPDGRGTAEPCHLSRDRAGTGTRPKGVNPNGQRATGPARNREHARPVGSALAVGEPGALVQRPCGHVVLTRTEVDVSGAAFFRMLHCGLEQRSPKSFATALGNDIELFEVGVEFSGIERGTEAQLGEPVRPISARGGR